MSNLHFPRTISALVITMLALPQAVFGQMEMKMSVPFNPNLLVTDEEMLDVNSVTKNDLAFLLSRGSLLRWSGPDAIGVNRPAIDIVWSAAQEFQISPKFLLTLLQREQSLVEDERPTQDQLDWAMGYAICDDCLKSDPLIQKFKGFGKQVYFAAKRIRESYLSDLNQRGFTETGMGPGREALIDNTVVTPNNQATAVLYTYTPHLQGNQNFVRIWNRWFNNRLVDGSLLQDNITGGIWLIQKGARRAITSQTAFYSRFNPQNVVSVNKDALESYPIGTPIQFPNYSLLRSPRGTVYLIVDDRRRGFTSQEAFRAFGFSIDEIVDVPWDDLNAYTEGESITTKTVYPQGALLQNKKTGGVYFVQNGLKHPIMSREILAANFQNPSIIPVDFADLEAYATTDPLLFPDGSLIAANGSPDIFVVTNGQRRHIKDEATFSAFGWRFNQVIWTNERSVLLHPQGKDISTLLDTTDDQAIRVTNL